MFALTVIPAIPPKEGESSFEFYFCSLFGEFGNCFFILDDWRPQDLLPEKQKVLNHYKVAALNIGRRPLAVYHGKRFLASYGFAIPSNYGRVYVFSTLPDESMMRSVSYDGYQINDQKLIPKSLIIFYALEGAWSFITSEVSLVDKFRKSIGTHAGLVETPAYLKKLR